MKSGFFDRLIERLDRLDPQSLQTQFLRLAQERGLLETIFQSIQEGVVVIDGEGRLSYANRSAEQLMGFSIDVARGRPVSNYLRDIDWDRVLRFDETEWTKLFNQEIEITYPAHRFLSFYIVPLSTNAEGERGVVVILRDITRDRVEEASLVESERLNAIKLLAAGVAHEIGNPLNALNIHLQLLGRAIKKLPEGEGEDLNELLEVASEEVSRLDLIINQFLRAIRPSKPKFMTTSIESLVKESLVLLKNEIQNRHIDVELDCPRELPKTRVDRNQIKQVLFNLIKNAFQAMPDRGALRIVLSSSDDQIRISIQDTGGGIRPEDLGRIFEAYHTTKPDGTGLGLMIVQRIVQEHGGSIAVSSKVGEGTDFSILLPLAERRVRLLKARSSIPEAQAGEPR